MVPEGGVEPPWSCLRRILSPLRLPVPPSCTFTDCRTGCPKVTDQSTQVCLIDGNSPSRGCEELRFEKIQFPSDIRSDSLLEGAHMHAETDFSSLNGLEYKARETRMDIGSNP